VSFAQLTPLSLQSLHTSEGAMELKADNKALEVGT
jgi:hypothetical protein